ncbi:TPA: H-NS histone family protein [Acinetobacter baumannii]|uniref:H-NS histone family protein n=1 Tax=Acinetobacter baumannii TaxID=470 RepID=UPI00338D6A07
MSEKNLADKTVEELKEYRKEIDLQIIEKERAEVIDLYEGMVLSAKNAGFNSIEDLHQKYLELSAQTKKAKRPPVEPRYRSKLDSQNTWTGRGKAPGWVIAEAEAAGFKRDNIKDFLKQIEI